MYKRQGWLCTHLESNLYAYTDQDGGITAALDSIVAQQADGVLVWGDTTEVPRMISGLRHAGYTGAILGPSFLAGYESLGINAGQATGLRFAAQYTDCLLYTSGKITLLSPAERAVIVG